MAGAPNPLNFGCLKKWPVSDCMRNPNKSHKKALFFNGKGSGTAIRTLYLRQDHHQKLNGSFH